MKFSDWRVTVEIIAALSIVISLVFVGLELRQSTSQASINAYQSFSISLSEFARDVSHDPVFSDLLARTGSLESYESASPTERIQLYTHYVGLLHLYNGLYQSVHEGLLLDKNLEAIYNDPAFGNDYIKALWPTIENMFEPNYREFIKRTIIESNTTNQGVT